MVNGGAANGLRKPTGYSPAGLVSQLLVTTGGLVGRAAFPAAGVATGRWEELLLAAATFNTALIDAAAHSS
jgi:hypothetical protein